MPPKCPSLERLPVGSVFEILHMNWSGATGIRTPDLLHAMNHSPVPRPGDMGSDQARRQLTLAAAGSNEPSLAAFCPSK